MVNEQIRKLRNTVTLSGIVAELEKATEGISNEVPWFRFEGKIQCGENPKEAPTLRFRTFVRAKKADGTDSKNFENVKKWYKNAVSILDATSKGGTQDEATKVKMIGSLCDNAYVNKENNLIESTTFNMQLFNEFDDYAAIIEIEGYLANIAEETINRNDDNVPTGRLKLRFISRDMFKNTLDLNKIFVPVELVKAFNGEEGSGDPYEKGMTCTLKLKMETRRSGQTSGIGEALSEGFKFTEMVMRGASAPEVSDEKVLDTDTVKLLVQARQSRLQTIKDDGYKGNSAPVQAQATTQATTKAQPAIESDDIFDSINY